MTTLTAAKAQKSFTETLDRVSIGRERNIVKRDGKELAAIIPVEDLKLLERLLEEVSQGPRALGTGVKYRLEWLPVALRDLRALPRDVQRRVASKVDLLADHPRPAGAKALQGAARGLMRVLIDEYRVVYRIRDA